MNIFKIDETMSNLEELWHRELRGKTVTPEQENTLQWAEERLRWPLVKLIAQREARAATAARREEMEQLQEFVVAHTFDTTAGRRIDEEITNRLAALKTKPVEQENV